MFSVYERMLSSCRVSWLQYLPSLPCLPKLASWRHFGGFQWQPIFSVVEFCFVLGAEIESATEEPVKCVGTRSACNKILHYSDQRFQLTGMLWFADIEGNLWGNYRGFSLTWPAAMQICWNKRKCLHKKRIQLLQGWFGLPTWPPFHCFGTPIWLPWHRVKRLYK